VGWVNGTLDQTWVNPATDSASPADFNQASYGYNGWMYTGAWPDDFVEGMPRAQNAAYRSETDIAHPAQTPAMYDAVWVNAWPLAKDKPPRDLYKFGLWFRSKSCEPGASCSATLRPSAACVCKTSRSIARRAIGPG